MEVISINIAQPTDIDYQGKTVSTGIFKQPVNHKTQVQKENIVGDGQADLIHHGGLDKAVYGFSADHYRYWRDTLHQPNLKYGAFGENLTISSLSEEQLCIGDRLEIGDTVLEVSQPRVPCFKLGIALDNVKAPSLFTKSNNTGVYFRVIKSGFITPGDNLVVVKSTKDTVSVQSLFRAYYDRHYSDSEAVLNTANKIEELAEEWRLKVIKKLQQYSEKRNSLH